MRREATARLLREDQAPVEDDFEDAAVALDQGRRDAVFLLDLGRQTGGPGQVVSAYAVFDRDLLHFAKLALRPARHKPGRRSEPASGGEVEPERGEILRAPESLAATESPPGSL